MSSRRARVGLALVLTLALIGGALVAVRAASESGRTYATAYFANSNGTYVGDHVLILGVPVGKIEKIEPQPERVKIVFWYSDRYKVPADAKAVIMSPTLVTARSIQLSPVYRGALSYRIMRLSLRTARLFRWNGTTCASSWTS